MVKAIQKTLLPAFLTLAMVISLLPAMTLFAAAVTTIGTGDGTYDFGSLNDLDGYEGAGFKTQGDKFLVSQCFAQDGTVIYPNSINAGTKNTTQDIVIKAEGGSTCKSFTFKDLSISWYGSAQYIDIFVLTLKNASGGVIDTLTMQDTQLIPQYTVSSINISTFNYDKTFSSTGYDNVSEIDISFRPEASDQAAVNSVFESITVANVKNTINTAPTVTTSTGSTSYTEQGTAVAIDSNISISDTDGDADWNGGKLMAQITANNTASDLLSLPTSNGGAIWLDTAGNKLMSNTTQIGTADAASVSNGTAWTFTFSSNATSTLVTDTAKAILFSNSSDDPGTSRTVTFTATDKNNGSASNTKTVSIIAVNDAPEMTATGANPTFTEDGSAADVFSTVSVSTIEAGQTLTELKLTVSNLADGSDEILHADGTDIALTDGEAGTTPTNAMSYSVSISGETATVTLSKAAGISAATMQTLVDGISYKNNSNTPTTGSRVITLTSIKDNGTTANDGVDTTALSIASTVTVVAVNDAPFTRNIPSFLQLGADAAAKSAAGTYATAQLDNITLESWIYLENTTGTHSVLFNGNGGTSGYGIYFGYPNEATVSVLLGGVGWIFCSSGTSYNPANNAVLTAGKWTHIAVTRNVSDGGTGGWKIYLNGQPMAAQFIPNPGVVSASPNPLNAESNVQIGGGSAGLSVSEARIWTRALTQSEIQANMSGTVPANATGLAGYWKLTDGSGMTVADSQTKQAALNLPITGTVTWVASTTASTAEDTAISGRLAGGDVETLVSYAKASNPAHGTVFVNSNGSYTYTPAANYNGSDSFTFVTNDGSADSAGRTVNITVTPVNDAPTLTTSGGTTAFTEGADTASTPVAVDSGITLTDPDNSTLASATVSITGNFQSGQDVLAFSNISAGTYGNIIASYDAETGILTLTSSGATATIAQWQSALRAVTYTNSSDTPNTSTRTISFTANDGTADGTAATKSVSVTASNDAPTLTSGAETPTYAENAAGVAVDSGITISDPDSTTVASATVSITAGFQANKDVLGFENGDAATYGDISAGSYNATTGVLTLTSAGAAATTAQWQAALRAVKFSSLSDNPGTTRTVSFKIKDGGNAESAAVTRNITITPVNDTPTAITLSSNTIAENAALGTTIGTLSTTDPDRDISFTYTLETGTGSDDNASFTTDGNTLKTATTFDYGTKHIYKIRVRTTDQGGLFFEQTFTINITQVNVAPTDIALSTTSVEENTGANFEVGTLTATDPNLSDTTFSYDFAAGDGSTDNASFNISGDKLRLTGSADYETKSSYSVRIKVTDNGGLTYEKAFTISVTNVNEAPVVTATSGTSAFSEAATGASTPVVVDGGLTVTDVDSGTVLSAVTAAISTNYNSAQDVLSFTNDGITMGNIAASFDSSTGILTLTSENGTATVAEWQAALRAVTYTNTSHNPTVLTRTITFSVSDGALSVTATKSVSVTQTNSAPTGIALSIGLVDENSPVGTTVGTLTATDGDADDAYTCSLVAGYGDNASFTIENVPGTGYVLKLAVSPNYEVKKIYNIRVRATDIAGATYDKDFTVTISDVNDAPSITSGDTASFAENGTGTVYTATATDPDAGNTIMFSIGGTDAALFNINGSTGILAFKTAPNFESPADSGADNVYDLTVTATDNGTGNLTATKAIAITVTNVNEAPVISTGNAISVIEGSTTAFTAAATDPEGNSIAWSITGGADAGKFSIVPGTGVVTFTTAPSYSTPTDADAHNDYVLEITATDGTLPAVKTVKVTVNQQSSAGEDTSTTKGTAVVEVNGQKQDAGTSATTTDSSGQTTTTVTVDTNKLQTILDSQSSGATVTIPITNNSDVAAGILTGAMVKRMESKDATLVVQTNSGTYTLPASEIDIDAVSQQLGTNVSLADINVTVSIAEPSASMTQVVENAAHDGGYTIMVPAVDYNITCTHGSQAVDVSSFNAYVERTIAIPDGVDPSKITTSVVVEQDGTIHHVPTRVTVVNGKYYAVINSLTNSTYSVIWNPVEFSDVTNSWAKDAVNDMGSRMVVTGVGDNNYDPDRNMTRAGFATIMVRALGLEPGTGAAGFGDVAETDWYSGYIKAAASYGIINGYDNGNFVPNDTITREQAMTMIARAMKITGLDAGLADNEINQLLSTFSDSASASAYAQGSIAACLKTGITSGTSATTLSPKDYITRAEVAVMVQRLLQKSNLI